MHSNTTYLTTFASTNLGVRQGCTTAPFLFVQYLADVPWLRALSSLDRDYLDSLAPDYDDLVQLAQTGHQTCVVDTFETHNAKAYEKEITWLKAIGIRHSRFVHGPKTHLRVSNCKRVSNRADSKSLSCQAALTVEFTPSADAGAELGPYAANHQLIRTRAAQLSYDSIAQGNTVAMVTRGLSLAAPTCTNYPVRQEYQTPSSPSQANRHASALLPPTARNSISHLWGPLSIILGAKR
ncbi:hypothetical protein J8273_0836 [Carpediemonas membranifera]|uniref:Uncharacterized protein n=1 Tax=Carpediemonas membranifera TaxID=201153 RepID=A0A8J6BCI1_9EUKA|nr:hypothetical protein J8273_0836 [Carpediemonas membranifera]|eukprot:KAG9397352.1 hypothetical protein J8273_0836 [Carpediemonas membranifera]